ncbi:MAG: hypothetical protein FWD53_00580, partial [Phycisphaerales bacterium]|nr:hypothetical protein [Phycisphaerales bacterium]
MLTKTRQTRPSRKPRHFLETLETRTLLSVTPTEFAQLQTMYPDLGLTAYEHYNIIDIPATNLTDAAIRQAITTASTTTANDLIVIRTTATQNTITLRSELTITIPATTYGSITIVSFGDEQLAFDAQHNSRIFHISNPSANVALAGLKIMNGSGFGADGGYYTGHGGGILNFGMLTVTESTFVGNTAVTGGGISNWDGGALTIMNSILTGNIGDAGGGIYNERGTLMIMNSIFTENITDDG